MPSITVSNLSWSTPDGRAVLADLDLQFAPERTAIVGRNGVGKSTLLRLLTGELTPAAGHIAIDGSIAMLRQTVQVAANETIADLFGIAPALALLRKAAAGTASADELAEADWTLEARLDAALAGIGLPLPPETPLAALSGGAAPAPRSPPRCSPPPISCCSTNRPTTSTAPAATRCRVCYAAGAAVRSSSATTANCSRIWTPSSN